MSKSDRLKPDRGCWDDEGEDDEAEEEEEEEEEEEVDEGSDKEAGCEDDSDSVVVEDAVWQARFFCSIAAVICAEL